LFNLRKYEDPQHVAVEEEPSEEETKARWKSPKRRIIRKEPRGKKTDATAGEIWR
jgi:hypothetical protein